MESIAELVERLRQQLSGTLRCSCGEGVLETEDAPLEERYSADWQSQPRLLKCPSGVHVQCSSCSSRFEEPELGALHCSRCPNAPVFAAAVAVELLRRVQLGLDKGWREVARPIIAATAAQPSLASAAPKAASSTSASLMCGICGFENAPSATACIQCTVTLPGASLPLASAAAVKGEGSWSAWTCTLCEASNDPSAEACAVCTFIRPPAQSALSAPVPVLAAPAAAAAPAPSAAMAVEQHEEEAPPAAASLPAAGAVPMQDDDAPAPPPSGLVPAAAAPPLAGAATVPVSTATRKRTAKELLLAVAEQIAAAGGAPVPQEYIDADDDGADVLLAMAVSAGEISWEAYELLQAQEVPKTPPTQQPAAAAAAGGMSASKASASAFSAQVRELAI
jgi:hypothetical protein